MIETLTLVVFATFVAVIIALPVGITAALSDRLYRFIMPTLRFYADHAGLRVFNSCDSLFRHRLGIGHFRTVIFSMPPAIRFTTLGIRQVPVELIEAADAYGATRSQKLFKVQLPLSLPTVMAGINQTIMLALFHRW